jgi:hypothetical protein
MKKPPKMPASEDQINAFRQAVLELDKNEDRLKEALANYKPQVHRDEEKEKPS